jgi:hypothetical protein
MSSTSNPREPSEITFRPDHATVFVSLELSRSKWLITSMSAWRDKLSKHSVGAGDAGALLDRLARLRMKAEQRLGTAARVVVIQEAGLDGFWIHRLLEAGGIESHVVEPASIAVPRRHRRAKTDVIDGEMLVRTLAAFKRGEPRVLLDGGRAEPGGGGPQAGLARAPHPAQGADRTRQPDQGPARHAGDLRMRDDAQGLSRPPRGPADG